MAARFGPRVLVQAMADKGVELAFGCVNDPDFGPIVMVSVGGTLVEYLADRRFAPAPFGPATARRMIEGLAVARLLQGARGAPPGDVKAAARALSRFSVMCAALGSAVTEIDANPVIVGPQGAVIVDALVVRAQYGPGTISLPSRNRLARNRLRSWPGPRPVIRSAMTRPAPGPIPKPWPLSPVAK